MLCDNLDTWGGARRLKMCVCLLVTQSCPTLCDPMDYSPPGSSVHGLLQARILEWVANSFSRHLPNPWIKPRSPALQAYSIPRELLGKHYIAQGAEPSSLWWPRQMGWGEDAQEVRDIYTHIYGWFTYLYSRNQLVLVVKQLFSN